MGYDPIAFLDALAIRDLTCSVCFDVVEEPLVCADRHLVCSGCFDPARGCSTCPEPNPCSPSPAHDERVARLRVHCLSLGCSWTGSVIEEHHEVCELRTIACPYLCETVGSAKEILTRHRDWCPNYVVPCWLCKVICRREDFEQHERACRHHPCSLASSGCDFLGTPAAVASHEANYCRPLHERLRALQPPNPLNPSTKPPIPYPLCDSPTLSPAATTSADSTSSDVSERIRTAERAAEKERKMREVQEAVLIRLEDENDALRRRAGKVTRLKSELAELRAKDVQQRREIRWLEDGGDSGREQELERFRRELDEERRLKDVAVDELLAARKALAKTLLGSDTDDGDLREEGEISGEDVIGKVGVQVTTGAKRALAFHLGGIPKRQKTMDLSPKEPQEICDG